MTGTSDKTNDLTGRPRVRQRRPWRRWGLPGVLLLCLAVGGYAAWRYHGPTEPIEIYSGIIYSCERLPDGPESGGLLHLVRANLNHPEVSLYVTPLDSDAVARGSQYKLKYVSTIVREQGLAAAVNGTLFVSESGIIRMAGDRATSNETVVSDHVPSHVHRDTYLMWWDDERIAHLETTKPPAAAALTKARWGIGGQQPLLVDGKVSAWAGAAPDVRTLIAADSPRRLVWIAVFDKASYRFAAQTLAAKGATIAVAVDGGTSSAMALGSRARGVRPGTITGNWRPVATAFGFRAE